MTFVVFAVSIIFFTVIFAQFKSVEETDLTGIKTAREEELQTILSEYKTKYEEMEEKLNDTQERISEYEKMITTNEKDSELLEKELKQTNMLVGKTDVVGEGIIVTLTDNSEKAIEPSDLRTLVNELKLAGAEAISINDKRVLNMTEIVEVNGGTILVNTERIASPYVVKAIGDKTYLSSALSLKNSGFIDTTNKVGKSAQMKAENKVEISAYNSDKKQLSFKYAQELEEE
jgi:uncharacterized protein YlxW (UPF0749 family)